MSLRPLISGLLSVIALLLAPATALSAEFDLDLYAELLEQHTRAVPSTVGTVVDYRGLRESADWRRLTEQVGAARPSRLSRPERLSFWINAYNILTIDLVLEHYPVQSIRKIGSFLFPVWNRDVVTLEGRSLSLGEIEHEILRKMDEPRIHAAIVCASTSCPSLARVPFRSDRIDADLDAAMGRWLADPRKGVSIDREKRTVWVSSIFNWFEADFQAAGGVLQTIAPYLPKEDAAWLREMGQEVRIRYLDYDWSLNDDPRR
jgi:hypothetical protein